MNPAGIHSNKSRNRQFKIYVAGIPSWAKAEEIRALFEPFGPISKIKTFSDHAKWSLPRIKGFCFLETPEKEAYDKILRAEHHFSGRTLMCSPVRMGKSLEARNNEINMKRALVKKVPSQMAQDELAKLLQEHAGPIDILYPMLSDKADRQGDNLVLGKSLAYSVLFRDKERAQSLITQKELWVPAHSSFITIEKYIHKHKKSEKKATTPPQTDRSLLEEFQNSVSSQFLGHGLKSSPSPNSLESLKDPKHSIKPTSSQFERSRRKGSPRYCFKVACKRPSWSL